MQSNYKYFDFRDSLDRLDEIITSNDTNYEEINNIPARDKLTFTNGFYVNCTALMVDIRKSSKLPSIHNRPTLAKLYRSYISEVVAILNGNVYCAEITINGDGILGIFDTPTQSQIDGVLSTSAEISSIVKFLNYKLSKKGIQQIQIGIGIDYGRALMIKAGYKGSSINDVVWIGEVINQAVHLSDHGNATYNDRETMISSNIYINLNDENKKLFSLNYARGCYHGNIVNTEMDNWYNENCK